MKRQPLYTPATLYADFQPNLPLRDSIVSDERIGDVIYNEVYFNGRETGDGRVLVYGIYAYHADGKRHNAILIIPDYRSSIDINVINLYVHLGYNVLMFDYKGECDGENFTHYPSKIKYANVSVLNGNVDAVPTNAKETCWYEWTCVASYAVSFLKTRLETNKIGVLGIKSGAEIMWHLVSHEQRITCAVALFGAGWRSYKGLYKYDGNTDFNVDDERIRFLAGIDSHAYAPYCKCPVALFTATNSGEYDADRAHDTIRRVNDKVDSFFCLSPRMSYAININCMRNIELFFGIYLNGQRILKLTEPTVKISITGERVELKVNVDADGKPKSVEVYVCENQTVPAKRNWVKLENVEKKSDEVFTADYTLINGGETVFAMAVVEYRNGITVSSPITAKKCPKTAVIKTNLIYSSEKVYNDFTNKFERSELVADAMFFRRNPVETVKGPMGINGVTAKNGLVTYKVNEKCVDIKADSIFVLDIYSRDNITFKVTVYTGCGETDETEYTMEVDVPKGEVWQQVMLGIKDLKTKDGMTINDCGKIDKIGFSANGFFVINNVLLI